MKRLLLPIGILSASIASLHAQSFFTPTARYLAPGWRGAEGEYSHWDVFYSPNENINYPDFEAPNGIGELARDAGFTPPANANPGDPFAFWHASNPTLTQTVPGAAFIIGPGISGNIYSFSAATAFQIADTTPFIAGSVVMQFQTDGTLMDFGSIKLTAGGVDYAPTNFITEYKTSGSAMGGVTNRTAAQWDLTGLGITNYTITFNSTGSSNSFQELLLDTTPIYAEAVASARTWTTASGAWSGAGHWSAGSLPPTGGNVTIASGSNLTVDGGTREIGELKLTAPGAFTIGASGGGVLKINTGITAEPVMAATYTINAPVELGSYHLSFLNAQTTLDFNQPISGATGLYFYGAGKTRLQASNTFTGSLTLDGGSLEISGANSYTGATAVLSGALVVKTNAPSGSVGALGNSSAAVTIGSGGTFGEPEAALIIDGAFSVDRSVTLSAGADAKKLGGRNTGTGATFSGSVTLNSMASGVRLHAEAATDQVTFTGAITGGSASGTMAKTGLGRVILSGATAKSYFNATTVEAGTLELAANASFTGNGAMTVAAGATLLVQGALSGSGALAVNGGTIGGSGTINRTFTLDTGDVLSPGNSPGTLQTIDQTWAGGGRLRLKINDVAAGAGMGWDLVNITGALSLTATTASKFTLEIDSLTLANAPGLVGNFNANTNYSWKFLDVLNSNGTVTGFDAGAFAFDLSGFQNSFNGSFSVSQSGNDLLLNYAAIPEPSSALLALSGAAFFLNRRRRPTRNQHLNARPNPPSF